MGLALPAANQLPTAAHSEALPNFDGSEGNDAITALAVRWHLPGPEQGQTLQALQLALW